MMVDDEQNYLRRTGLQHLLMVIAILGLSVVVSACYLFTVLPIPDASIALTAIVTFVSGITGALLLILKKLEDNRIATKEEIKKVMNGNSNGH